MAALNSRATQSAETGMGSGTVAATESLRIAATMTERCGDVGGVRAEAINMRERDIEDGERG